MTKPYRTWVYHQIKLPKGKIIMSDEAERLYRKGWVDTPAKFGKGIRGKWYCLILKFRKLKQWATNNPNTSIPLIVMATIGIIGIIVTLFINLRSDSASHATQKTNTQTNNKKTNYHK